MTDTDKKKGRLIVVSNRAPSICGTADAGGLVVALRGTLERMGGLWVGANPEPASTPGDELVIHKRDDFDIAHFSTTEAEQEDFYLGYANSVLWPVFHGRVDLMSMEARFAPAYWTVNERIARGLVSQLRPNDTIWVQDYQLIPLARELRRLGVKNSIGFFLHIPVPDVQSFRTIPQWKRLTRGLCAYDLVGLQATRDVTNLIDICRRAVGAELLPSGALMVDEQRVRVGAFPISIDTQAFRKDAERSAAAQSKPPFARLIGVDRLDYSKGLPQRFEAYERFLSKPENARWHGNVQFLQVAPPTRTGVEAYDDIRSELEALAGRINGAFGTVDWTPIQYIHRPLPREELAGLYRQSRVALVTPLFDGMNLVAKEFVAAQDEADPGVLILSEFAGAAEELKSALLVNPHDIEQCADAIGAALDMSLHTRIRRHTQAFDHIARNDIAAWTRAYLDALGKSRGGMKTADKPVEDRLINIERSMAQALAEDHPDLSGPITTSGVLAEGSPATKH
ncbi:MAG: trehalose-6-phosphate synthase [Pseudomonadota bacterium]